MRWPPLSLSARLTALVLGLLLLALTLIGVTLGLRIRDFAQTQAERATYGQLALIVQSAEASTETGSTTGAGTTSATGTGTPASGTPASGTPASTTPSTGGQDYEYQVFQSLVKAAQDARSWGFFQTSASTYVTDSLSRPLPPTAVLRAAGQAGRASWGELRLLSDGRGNVLGLALNAADSDALTRGVVQNYAAIALAALLLAGAAVLLLLRLGLRPLRVMAGQAARLGVGDLSERMPVSLPEDELNLLSVGLNRMLARLQDAFARLSAEEARTRDFAADASHELRTPLAAIAGSLEVLERVGLDDRGPQSEEVQARLIANLRRESRRAGRLVDDLLTLTRLGAGEGLHPVRLPLVPLLGGVLDTVRDLAPHLHFVLDIVTPELPAPSAPASPDDVPLHVTADPGRLEGALLNLLRNAAAHTPEGGTVTLRALPDGPNLRLSVLNPARLAPEFLPRLFDRFARGPDAVAGGSGLGLAIVRAVAQAHGGDTFALQHDAELEVGLTVPQG
ncbi:sensor histidine kinase [Deinococcus altitudinis]|uniref:sensor histidine kinase n=1 Tax=Deinococcus altitudinis TaxID=468914 RepID=UPI003892B5C7